MLLCLRRCRSTAVLPGRMRSVTAGRIRRGSSSTTCSSPTNASCLRGGGAGAAIGKRKRPGWGETGPSHSHASVWGTLGGSRVLPEMVSDPLKFKNPPQKSGVQTAKSRKDFEKNFKQTAESGDFRGIFRDGGKAGPTGVRPSA